MENILLGLGLVGIGSVSAVYANYLTRHVMRITFLERYLLPSSVVYQLAGFGMIILGVLLIFGIFTPGESFPGSEGSNSGNGDDSEVRIRQGENGL
jgi:hypothetical protein